MTRSLLLALALLVGITSQTMAISRGQTMVAGQAVLCLGGQVVTVTLDAEGKPTGPAHICPDMALAFLVAHDDATPALILAPGAATPITAATVWLGQGRDTPTATARGPPETV